MCLGRVPLDDEIKLMQENPQIQHGLNLIFEGNKECYDNGLIILDFDQSNSNDENPKKKSSYNLYLSESRKLIEMGYKREQFQHILRHNNGNIDKTVYKLLINLSEQKKVK